MCQICKPRKPCSRSSPVNPWVILFHTVLFWSVFRKPSTYVIPNYEFTTRSQVCLFYFCHFNPVATGINVQWTWILKFWWDDQRIYISSFENDQHLHVVLLVLLIYLCLFCNFLLWSLSRLVIFIALPKLQWLNQSRFILWPSTSVLFFFSRDIIYKDLTFLLTLLLYLETLFYERVNNNFRILFVKKYIKLIFYFHFYVTGEDPTL